MKLSFQFANYKNILENYIGNTAVWWMTEENCKFISKICLTFIQSDFKKNLFYAIRLNVNICSANYYFLHLLFWSIWKIVSTEFYSTTNEFPKGFPPVSFWCGIFHVTCLNDSWIPYSLLAAMRCIQMFISAMHKSGFKCIFMLKYFLFVFKTLTRTFQDGLQIGENKCKILEIFFSQNFKCFELGCISSLKKVQWVCFSMCVYSEQLETAQTFSLNPVFAEYIIELLFHIGSFITCCSALVFGALVNEWARLLKPN